MSAPATKQPDLPWTENARTKRFRGPERDTSAAARAKIAGGLSEIRRVVLQTIGLASRGLTDEQIQSITALAANTECPARLYLERHGLVMDSGRRRATRRGNKAIVWVLAREKDTEATTGGESP